jgi:hypothetical protein
MFPQVDLKHFSPCGVPFATSSLPELQERPRLRTAKLLFETELLGSAASRISFNGDPGHFSDHSGNIIGRHGLETNV